MSRHEWEEDGRTYAVEQDSEGDERLVGEHFSRTFTNENEAPLTREILRLAERATAAYARGFADGVRSQMERQRPGIYEVILPSSSE